MDADFFNSIQEDHQLAMMLMQMDKLPQLSTPFSDNNPQEMPMNFGTNNNMLQVLDNSHDASTTISFSNSPQEYISPMSSLSSLPTPPSHSVKRNAQVAAMREMIYRIAAMQPIHIDPESVKPPKRKNVKISKDPQSVAARHRRERISERMRILQRLVPGGTKMDTASMLDEAIHYVKFLKNQVQSLEHVAATMPPVEVGYFPAVACLSYLPLSSTTRSYHPQVAQNVQHFADV